MHLKKKKKPWPTYKQQSQYLEPSSHSAAPGSLSAGWPSPIWWFSAHCPADWWSPAKWQHSALQVKYADNIKAFPPWEISELFVFVSCLQWVEVVVVSVFTLHTLPLQWLLSSPKSLQLNSAALELTTIIYDLLLAPTKGILVRPSSVRQTLHTHCTNDTQKDVYVLENHICCVTQSTGLCPKIVWCDLHVQQRNSAFWFSPYACIVVFFWSWDTWPVLCPQGLREPLGVTLTVSICQSVVWLSSLPPPSMNEAHCCSQLDTTQGRSFCWHLSLIISSQHVDTAGVNL